MRDKSKGKKQAGPMQFRPTAEIRAKLKRIAEVNGLSMQDVLNLSAAAGANMVEQKLAEMKAA